MKQGLFIFSIIILYGCIEKRTLTQNDYEQIRSISLDSLFSKWDDNDTTHSKLVIDIHLADSIDITEWRHRFFHKQWLDTIEEFSRNDFIKLAKKNDIVYLNNEAEKELKINSSYIDIHITDVFHSEYISKDTIGHVTLFPMICSTDGNKVIQMIEFYKYGDWAFTASLYFKKNNGIWVLQGKRMLRIS